MKPKVLMVIMPFCPPGQVEAAVLQSVFAKHRPVGDSGMTFDRFLPALEEASGLSGCRLGETLGRLVARGGRGGGSRHTSPSRAHGMSGSFTAPPSLATSSHRSSLGYSPQSNGLKGDSPRGSPKAAGGESLLPHISEVTAKSKANGTIQVGLTV